MKWRTFVDGSTAMARVFPVTAVPLPVRALGRGNKMKTILLLFFLSLSACVTANTNRSDREPQKEHLRFDFELQEAILTDEGAIQGRLLVHVLAGRASFSRGVEPFVSPRQPIECGTERKLKFVAVDYVARDETRNIVEQGEWYGRDVEQSYLGDTMVPDCVVAPLTIMVDDASFPDAQVKEVREIKLYKTRK
jgi:hypothetical protein